VHTLFRAGTEGIADFGQLVLLLAVRRAVIDPPPRKVSSALTWTTTCRVLRNDFLFGRDGNDTLDEGDGSDTIDGGNGTDTCTGKFVSNCTLD
jgi:Ca2+-binding RTX toxin-like protein